MTKKLGTLPESILDKGYQITDFMTNTILTYISNLWHLEYQNRQQLLAYRDSPSDEVAVKLQLKFGQLFSTESDYQQWDERKR